MCQIKFKFNLVSIIKIMVLHSDYYGGGALTCMYAHLLAIHVMRLPPAMWHYYHIIGVKMMKTVKFTIKLR